MPGRKQPETTEPEKDREYRLYSKREAGESLQGDLGAGLDAKGAHGEVKAQREARAGNPERGADERTGGKGA